MNYFVEGLQGSGKSTLVSKLQELHPKLQAIREGEYSPVELAWCAYLDEEKYPAILEKYPSLRKEIEEKTYSEGTLALVLRDVKRRDNPVTDIQKTLVSFYGFENLKTAEEAQRQ